MLTPLVPEDEDARIEKLRLRHLMHSPMEELFDAITRAARQDFDVPIALISLVGANEQWFKSAQGLHVPETSRDISLCAHAICSPNLFIVEDASRDERFSDNPLVSGPPKIRFYAGVPLRLGDGSALGTLCIIDRKPRRLSDREKSLLRILGKAAEAELARVMRDQITVQYLNDLGSERKRMQAIDPLTRTWGANALRELFERSCSDASPIPPLAMFSVGISSYPAWRGELGSTQSDRALFEISGRLRKSLTDLDYLGHVGNGEFIIILRNPRPVTMAGLASLFRDDASDVIAKGGPESRKFEAPVGYVKMGDMPGASYPEIWQQAAEARQNAHFLDGVCKGPLHV